MAPRTAVVVQLLCADRRDGQHQVVELRELQVRADVAPGVRLLVQVGAQIEELVAWPQHSDSHAAHFVFDAVRQQVRRCQTRAPTAGADDTSACPSRSPTEPPLPTSATSAFAMRSHRVRRYPRQAERAGAKRQLGDDPEHDEAAPEPDPSAAR